MEIIYLAEGDNLVFAGKENMETVSSLYLAPHYMSNGDELCEILLEIFMKDLIKKTDRAEINTDKLHVKIPVLSYF